MTLSDGFQLSFLSGSLVKWIFLGGLLGRSVWRELLDGAFSSLSSSFPVKKSSSENNPTKQ